MPKYTQLFLKRGNYQTLYYSTDILASGEAAIAVDSGILKIGNGIDTWNVLPSVGVPCNTGSTSGAAVLQNMVKMTQTDYDALPDPDPNTLYFII